ncbi:hypothetical protein M406DRAFT_354047 [Cryphonectria parasitica EP155]|uniref:C6 transcription factor n=1 Tax=Cryphonectria parasitica (strain ATCC 38755 / EP155) TaxID=660469 RepID=A0A9P4Y9Y7_CRYP1|nr:uncharacterized protein M406DRAFT_354047 [Cryphonectria parasitica EP155]KAF3769543.1 hypothetical protein M406DRAFT_354047 [Cryphonectria parasitica EP155]
MVGTRSSSGALAPGLKTPTTLTRRRDKKSPSLITHGWSHAPSNITLAWLAISLPLVTWDTGYVLGRPATMPGGWAHSPVWKPYDLYGNVDHMYGFKQWNLGNGFTAAQAWLNVVESLMYLAYIALWYRAGGAVGGVNASAGAVQARRRVAGRAGALAVVVGLAASVMTVSKTVLYWLNEYFSGFDNIGHNKPWDLILLWIIPNGLWLVVPSYMIYQIGSEIIDAITIASQATGSAKDE